MEENYYALIICIIRGCSPKHSFDLIRTGKITITDNDIKYMNVLKRKMTYKQIGQIYGVCADTIYRLIKRSSDKNESKMYKM
jgi:uncharacterized protein YerC